MYQLTITDVANLAAVPVSKEAGMDKARLPGVNDAFRDKRVLVIGATGFLGKIIVEKLLREAPDIGRVTLLVRSNRRGGDAAGRVDKEIIDTPLFGHLRETIGATQFAERISRLAAITGDVTQPDLGLDAARYSALANSTDIVINSAASVNFREELDQALNTNTYAADRLLDFAAQDNIPILHISTCYVSSFDKGLITETNHGPAGAKRAGGIAPQDPGYRHFLTDDLIRDLQMSVDDTANKHTNDPNSRAEAMVVLGQAKAGQYGWNDCYTMTKWLAEQRLLDRRQHGPLTILRPSIIESTQAAPFAGWLEGIKVADAVIFGYAKRGLSMFPARKDRVIDIIPADSVANSVLLAGVELMTATAGVRIYQCSSGTSNPLTIGQLRDHVVAVAHDQHETFPRLFAGKPKHGMRLVSPVVYGMLASCIQVLMQGLDRIMPPRSKRRGRAVRFGKAQELVSLFAFYASPDYVFCNRRLTELHSAFPAADRERLPVDTGGMSWKHYFSEVHIPGLHRYVLKGDARRPEGERLAPAVTPDLLNWRLPRKRYVNDA